MSSKDQDIRKQTAEVSSWLSYVLKHKPIPDFEMTAQTLQLLHRLSVVSQFNERNVRLCVDDFKKKSEEYSTDVQRIGCILDKLTFGQNSLSRSGYSCVQALSRAGALLDVKDASDTCYMLSIRELKSSVDELTEKLKAGNEDLQKLSKKTQTVLLKHSSLEKVLEVLEKKSTQKTGRIAERKKETSILRKATAENELTMEKLKGRLVKSGVSQSDFHGKLVKKKEKLDALENELDPLKLELQSYISLPPDTVDAKVKIEQLKRELCELQTKMSECVDVALLQ